LISKSRSSSTLTPDVSMLRDVAMSSVIDTSQKGSFWSPQALSRSVSLGYATPRRIEKIASFSLQSCCLDIGDAARLLTR
jgi:hypothetical protein